MDMTQKGVIALLKSALTGEKVLLPEGFDLAAAIRTVASHQIGTMAYEGAIRCGIPSDDPAMQRLFQYYCKAVQVSARQKRELDKVFAAFEKNGIDYLPLKGSALRELYPKQEFRLMGDADVLIRMEQYEQIAPVMEKVGFRKGGGDEHELIWANDALELELHRYLFASKYEDLYAFFGDGWSMAKQCAGTRHAMTPEDTFIYVFAHFTKHFQNAGIGCRQLIDLWVFLRAHPELDELYIRSELEKLQLNAFYQNVRRTVAVWFEDGAADDVTEMITEIIFNNGSWGTSQNLALSRSARDTRHDRLIGNERVNYFLKAMPDKKRLRRTYPVLERMPWLTPVMWLHFVIRKALFTKGTLRRVKRDVSVLTKDNVDSHRQMLEFVGLE